MRTTKAFCEQILATENFWTLSTGKQSNGGSKNMQGAIQELGQSQKGNPKVKINGQWYSIKTHQGYGVGSVLDYEASQFQMSGKTYHGIDKFAVVPPNGAAPTQSTAHVPVTPMVSPGPVAAAALTGDELRFISNVVGSAITSGKIVDPVDLVAWTKGAQGALKSLAEGSF